MNQIRYVLLTITLVALVGVSALALNVPNSFVSGDVISAAEMNANFAAVEAAVTALENAQPVVAHTKVDGIVDVESSEMTDVVVVSVDAPAAGVVLVQFVAQAAFDGLATQNGMAFQIDTTAGGTTDLDQYFLVAQTTPPNTGRQWYPVAAQRAYAVAAGTHTYRTEAEIRGDASGTRYFWNPSMTATWYPEGSVTLAAALSTSGGADDVNEP